MVSLPSMQSLPTQSLGWWASSSLCLPMSLLPAPCPHLVVHCPVLHGLLCDILSAPTSTANTSPGVISIPTRAVAKSTSRESIAKTITTTNRTLSVSKMTLARKRARVQTGGLLPWQQLLLVQPYQWPWLPLHLPSLSPDLGASAFQFTEHMPR